MKRDLAQKDRRTIVSRDQSLFLQTLYEQRVVFYAAQSLNEWCHPITLRQIVPSSSVRQHLMKQKEDRRER